jgi:transcriptional regulator with XRE-family HTH domain
MNIYDIGSILKKLRKERNLTLKDVSREINLTSAMISLIENGKSIPSLRTISKLATYYDVSICNIFDNNIKKRYTIYRKIRKNVIDDIDTNKIYVLLSSIKNAKMRCSIIEIVKYCNHLPMTAIKGDSFIFIIEGNVEVTKSCERYYINEGDSIYLDNVYEIGLRPIGCSMAKVMRIER